MITEADHKEAATIPAEVFGVKTGWFHYSKRFVVQIIKPFIPKIQHGIDTVYDKTRSSNAEVFKEVIAELDKYDEDIETGSSIFLAMKRKALNLLAAKFLICLYEYDLGYAERMDYVLKRIIERQDELYFDEQSDPENWHPHHKTNIMNLHMRLRMKYKNVPKR